MTPIERKVYILSNLQRAIDVMMLVEPDNVNLSVYRCGTQACLAGWLCTDPHFQQFMRLVPRSDVDRGTHVVILDRNVGEPEPKETTDGLDFDAEFGPCSMELFDWWRESEDSDHVIALNRLHRQIDIVQGMDPEHLYNPDEVAL